MDGQPSHRRSGRFDAAMSLAARALPKRLTPALEQARLDAGMVIDRMGGTGPSPVLREAHSPIPLSEVDPLDLFPRGVANRLRAVGRDARMLRDRLILGKNPSPLIARPKAARGALVSLPNRTPNLARPLKVVDVVHETKDAVSIYVTEADGSAIEFQPGQFLSVDVMVDGERLRRAYSIASPCVPDAPVHVTVKRVADGRVSNYLNDTIAVGDELAALGPSGKFTVEARPVNERQLVMIAGGSGITPIISILETILRVESESQVALIYGNRGWDDVIFRERLQVLEGEYGERLTVDHVLEEPPEWWTGEQGLLGSEVLESRLRALGIEDDGVMRYFVCGPTPMMEATHEALERRGIGSSRIAEERFTSPEARAGKSGSEKIERVLLTKNGNEQAIRVEPGQTILEAALAAGVDMPFSCAMGGCAACRCRLVEGELQMEEPNCLSRAERERGYVLTCVGRPLGPCTVEVEGV